MWDSLFQFIPEKRLPSALHAAVFLSIALPVLAAVSALIAWKLHARLGHVSEAGRASGLALSDAATEAKQTDLEARLRSTQATLVRTEAALQQAREHLKQSEIRAQTAAAHAA